MRPPKKKKQKKTEHEMKYMYMCKYINITNFFSRFLMMFTSTRVKRKGEFV